jgi:hypothetical protein
MWWLVAGLVGFTQNIMGAFSLEFVVNGVLLVGSMKMTAFSSDIGDGVSSFVVVGRYIVLLLAMGEDLLELVHDDNFTERVGKEMEKGILGRGSSGRSGSVEKWKWQ